MAGEHRPWRRQREDFWRAHHEAWKLSDLNQREYYEAHELPQKGVENSKTDELSSKPNHRCGSESCSTGAAA